MPSQRQSAKAPPTLTGANEATRVSGAAASTAAGRGDEVVLAKPPPASAGPLAVAAAGWAEAEAAELATAERAKVRLWVFSRP